MRIDPDLVGRIAGTLGVDEAFIEKDFIVSQVLLSLANFAHDQCQLVFSGGTSLSKGYGLVERFSEDIDFKVRSGDCLDKAGRKSLRKSMVSKLREAGWEILDKNISAGDENRYTKIAFDYVSNFTGSSPLRPHVQIEVTTRPPALPPQLRPLQSFVSRAQGHKPEVSAFPCISPIETAADKLAALTWRVLQRGYDPNEWKPETMRHLMDLAALEGTISDAAEFPPLALERLESDRSRGRPTEEVKGWSSKERAGHLIHALASEAVLNEDYQNFAAAMSYARNEDKISYQDATSAADRLLAKIFD